MCWQEHGAPCQKGPVLSCKGGVVPQTELTLFICIIFPPIRERKCRLCVIRLFQGSVKIRMYDLNNAEELWRLLLFLISLRPSGRHCQTFGGKCTEAEGFSEGHLRAYLSSIFAFYVLSPTAAFLLQNNGLPSSVVTEIKGTDCKTPVKKIFADKPSFFPWTFLP